MDLWLVVAGADAVPVKTREWSSARSVIGAERTVTFLSVFPPTVVAELLVSFCYRSCLIDFPDS